MKFDDLNSSALSTAAHEMKKFEIARAWIQSMGSAVPGIQLHWIDGRPHPGHDVMRHEIEQLVKEQYHDLLEKAFERIELRARRAFAEAVSTQPTDKVTNL